MSGAAARVETRELQRLADSGLPARVRGALEHALHIVADDLQPRLAETLGDLEQQLFRLAEQARSPSIEASYLQILRTVRANRDALVPAMLAQVEDRLARLRRPPAGPSGGAAVSAPMALSLSLVDDIELQEDALLGEIAQRQQGRASLGLHLIGQRFGVLAAAPAFEARRLPLGPQSMCSCLRAAAAELQVSLSSRESPALAPRCWRTMPSTISRKAPRSRGVPVPCIAASCRLPSTSTTSRVATCCGSALPPVRNLPIRSRRLDNSCCRPA